MLDHLTGDVVRVGTDSAVLSLGGVGIVVQMPTSDLVKLQGRATVHTVMQIKDEDVHLYGFSTEHGRSLFRALTSVGGVGPKGALALLSLHAPAALERAVVTGDVDALTLASGIGKKIAQRIVLELRDKLGLEIEQAFAKSVPSALGEVRDALKGLGYSPQEVQHAIADLPPDGDAPTLLRHALKALGSREAAG